jgi:predicted dehydrogenase
VARKVRIGVVGTSWWLDAYHGPTVASHPGAELAALCGRNRARAEEMAAKYGVKAVYTDYRAMFREAGLDVVVISTPDDTHYEIAMAALDAGLHINCEKPLALTAADARAMYERARQAGVIHMTNFTWRTLPVFRRLRELVQEGYIGRCFHAALAFCHPLYRAQQDQWRLDPARANGVLGDLGPHMSDLLRWVTGEEPAAVSARLRSYARWKEGGETPAPRANDDACLLLGLAGGGTATIEVSGVRLLDQIAVSLTGDRGMLQATFRFAAPSALRGMREGEADLAGLPLPPELGAGLEGLTGLAELDRVNTTHSVGNRRFVDCLLEGKPMDPSFYDGWRAQEVIEAALESDRSGSWVPVAPP